MATKMTDAEKVEAFMADLNHPFKAEVEALRTIIRNASPQLAERIKWNAPSYYLGKCDMAAFNLHQKEFLQLIFVFYGGTMIHESKGLLSGTWKDRREARFHSMEDVVAKQAALEEVVNTWVELVEEK